MNLTGELATTYQIVGQIGAGGGGIVYKAYHTRLQKYVVLKKIRESSHLDMAALRTETDILKNLRHSYLPQVLDFVVQGNEVYTVMDFIPGQSLKQYIDAGYHFSEKEIVRIGTQLCEALAYLHSQKPAIIHGDIKPANIMITPDGNVCLIDFNISGLSNGKKAYIQGYSEGYAAPEQLEAYQAILAARQSQAPMQHPLYQQPAQPVQQASQYQAPMQPPFIQKQGTQETVMLQNPGTQETVMLQNLGTQETVQLGQQETIQLQQFQSPAQPVMQPQFQAPVQPPMQPQPVMQPVQRQQPQPQPAVGQSLPGIPVDMRSDVYSLAATLYQLLTGQQIQEHNARALSSRVSDGFCLLLNKALQKDPEKRYQNATQMLAAFRNVYKMDKRYKKMIFRQQLAEIFFILLFAAGVILFFMGRDRLEVEKEERYRECVTTLEEAREQIVAEMSDTGIMETETSKTETPDMEAFDVAYDEAVALYPDYMEAYYQKSLCLFEQHLYAETIDYIEDDVLEQSELFNDDISTIYYLLGRSSFELEDYNSAVDAYANAISYNDAVSDYYVEYAISLARTGALDKAQRALEDAKETDASDELVLLTAGEIDRALGETESAKENFGQCIQVAKDDYVRLRAYLFASMLYDELEANEENLTEGIALLQEAKTSLPLTYQSFILERLAQAYIDAGTVTGNLDYYQSAIGQMQEIITAGWADYTTYSNMIVLYERCGDLDAAEAVIEQIEEANSTNYELYKRKAFLEIDRQEQIYPADRNYDTFVTYYEQAKEYYAQEATQTDTEMPVLDNLYEQLVEGNWIQ